MEEWLSQLAMQVKGPFRELSNSRPANNTMLQREYNGSGKKLNSVVESNELRKCPHY